MATQILPPSAEAQLGERLQQLFAIFDVVRANLADRLVGKRSLPDHALVSLLEAGLELLDQVRTLIAQAIVRPP